MKKYCYLNGKILSLKNANLPINDIGILRGYGVFDYLRTYDGAPFLFDDHFTRFQNSAKAIGLEVSETQANVQKIIRKLTAKNKVKDAGVRLVLTGGPSEDGYFWDNKNSNFFILIQELHFPEVKKYQDGTKLITIEFQREIPRAKTNNYLTRLQNNDILKENDADDLLYIVNKNVLEGGTCNIFAVINHKLITPKDGILLGTRRNLIVKLAQTHGKEVEERQLSQRELLAADEAFITSTTRDILPVCRIDDHIIGTGKPGAVTKEINNIYKEYIEEWMKSNK